MPRSTAVQLRTLIRKLSRERASHVAAIEEIDKTLSQFGIKAEEVKPGRRKRRKRRGRKPGPKPGSKRKKVARKRGKATKPRKVTRKRSAKRAAAVPGEAPTAKTGEASS